jgi:Putative transposase
VLSRERKDMERLGQYIIRNPFSVEKMRASEPGPASASGSILYRSGMNKKIGRNFEVFTPCDFIAAITQHIPDKSFQLVRYYGWYSNKMRGRRAKQADEEVQTEGDAVEVIDVSAHEPRRSPSKKWRELIKKVWEADPLRCPKCSREMRIVSLIDQEDVIERILRHLGLWQEGCACIPAPTRRAKRPSIRGSTTPSPTTTPNRSWRSPPPETPGSARVRLSHPLFSGPQPSGGSCLTSGPTFVTLRPWKRTLSASDSGPTPRRAKSDFLSVSSSSARTRAGSRSRLSRKPAAMEVPWAMKKRRTPTTWRNTIQG